MLNNQSFNQSEIFLEEMFEDTKGVSETINLRYKRGIRNHKSKILKGYQKP
jgi:hypothetical protein